MKAKSMEQHERHKRGICPACGGNNDRFPKWYCTTCLNKHNVWAVEHAKLRRSLGICPRCGKSMEKGLNQCEPCTTKHNLELRKIRAIKRMKKNDSC